jgi:twinkle protein
MDQDESAFIKHIPCDNCGSSDANSLYTDGHTHCFACKKSTFTNDGEQQTATKTTSTIQGYAEADVRGLSARKISEETCRLFGVRVGQYKGKTAHFYPYYQDNQIVACKVRGADKAFSFIGDAKSPPLFGMNLWSKGKKIIVTEGEIDALTVSQVQGNKWPVVSVPNGAQGAKKSIQKHLEYLNKFDEVILMFDMDEPGQKAAQECVDLLPPGKAKIASLPYKDPNECLLNGKGDAIVQAVWNAKEYRPASVLTVEDAFEDAIRKPVDGIPWPWPSLTKLTYGIHRKCSYYLGAGTGIGKTNWAKELQSWLVNQQGLPVGVFMLEESSGRTLKGIAGKFVGKPFHKPDAVFTEDELRDAIRSLDGKVYLYNHAKHDTDWDSIKSAIRYMVVRFGVKDIFLDNLTVMVAHLSSSEANDEVNRIAKEMKEMVQELEFTIYGFSHLNPPTTGPAHERGGKVLESQFTGSRALMRFGNYMMGLERNKDPEIPLEERNLAQLVLLKDREFGNVGRFPIRYYPDTDQFLEPAPSEAYGFNVDSPPTSNQHKEAYGF